jgi:hypothetical protein
LEVYRHGRVFTPAVKIMRPILFISVEYGQNTRIANASQHETHFCSRQRNPLKLRRSLFSLHPSQMTIDEAKRKIARLSCQRDYWQRVAMSPDSERSRKAVWRRRNPAGYRREILRNRQYARARTLRLRAIIAWAMAWQIRLAKRSTHN